MGGGIETLRQLQGLRYSKLVELNAYATYDEARAQIRQIMATVIPYLKPERKREIIDGILETLQAIENPREIAEHEAFEAELQKLNMRILGGR